MVCLCTARARKAKRIRFPLPLFAHSARTTALRAQRLSASFAESSFGPKEQQAPNVFCHSAGMGGRSPSLGKQTCEEHAECKLFC